MSQDLIDILEENIFNILDDLKIKDQEIEDLKNENSNLKDKIQSLNKNLKVAQDKNNELKIISGLSGNKEHRRLMKLKLNSLVKEVDICIAELKKQKM